MPNPIDAIRPTKPCFTVGVVAPLGYEPPGLGRFVRNRLRELLGEKRRTHHVYFHAPTGEPLSRAVGDLAREWATQCGGLGGGGRSGRYADHLRACANVATFSHAVVMFHSGGPLPSDLTRLVGVCEWLGTEVRVLAFAGDPVPL